MRKIGFLIVFWLCESVGANGSVVGTSILRSMLPCPPGFAEIGFKTLPTSLKITPDIAKAYYINVLNAEGVVEQKTVRLLPVDNWGLPESFKGKVYELAITVSSREESHALIQSLVAHGPAPWKNLIVPPLQDGMSGYDIGNSLYFYTRTSERAHEVGARPLQLIVQFPANGDGPTEAMNLIASLEAHGLTPAPRALQDMKLDSVGAKGEWATYSFASWAKSLSTEESRALSQLGGPEYREINGYLRSPHIHPDPRMTAVIANADSAISKGSLNREITTYRYDSSPRLLEIWEKLSKSGKSNGVGNPKIGNPTYRDPGYGFTTIDPAVANWWNKSQLGGNGILLEIELPRGTSAAFLDSPGIFNNRGYLELVLKRNSEYEVTGFRENADGQKVLKIRYLIENLKHQLE